MPLSDRDQQTIEAAQARYRNQLAAIRADVRLTDAGKRVEIARAYKQASGETRAVRDRVAAENARRRAEIEPQLFGVGSSPTASETMSYRDAMDRALNCDTSDQLARVMDAAKLTGDQTLQKACFTVAWQRADETTGRGYIALVDGVLASDSWTNRLAESYGAHLDQPAGLFPDITKPGELRGVEVDQFLATADVSATA